ncbi:hypothetical protein NSK_006220 [Nannochloropsis salina CCMP1776]|uniref:Zinc/iron permease n=1 Tax=Nannochloropsis salina CCMP1776 TaxID=1027361 RepID=A0A4D9CUA9_9STRA|nr:hypothetical protein NSK_006220 [Nannochloropsis salina CCMP1776]|eukprot:TFJ82476.1 hypothetical protein NSK_006220 [Nannochloropsis salina CCMP1776]
MELCSGPSVFMFLMSFAIFIKPPSVTFVNAMQHLGGGIVLSAVATELLPAMSRHKHSWQNTLATLVGFFTGVVMMVSVAHFCGEVEEVGEEEEEDGAEGLGEDGMTSPLARPPSIRKAATLASHSTPTSNPRESFGLARPGLSRRRSLLETYRVGRAGGRRQADLSQTSLLGPPSPSPMRRAVTLGGARAPPSSLLTGPRRAMSITRAPRSFADSSLPAPSPRPPLGKTHPATSSLLPSEDTPLVRPSGLPAASLEHGAVDMGREGAGLVMSVALTIEMGFLGLTFSAGMAKVKPSLRYALIVGAPAMILVGGTIGAFAAALLAANPTYQVALLAFGVAALLYLITEELLVEAHEAGRPHVWYVDLMFFVGFIASVLLEQNIEDSSKGG